MRGHKRSTKRRRAKTRGSKVCLGWAANGISFPAHTREGTRGSLTLVSGSSTLMLRLVSNRDYARACESRNNSTHEPVLSACTLIRYEGKPAHHQENEPESWLVEVQLAHSGTRTVNCILGAQKNRPLKSESIDPRDPPAGGKNKV